MDGKQSVGQDLAPEAANDLSQLRPSIVIAEGTTDSAMREEVIVEKALNKVTGMEIQMGHEFEERLYVFDRPLRNKRHGQQLQ